MSKTTLKLILISLTSFVMINLTFGQVVNREIGVRTPGLNSIGGVYKWQKEETRYGRLTAAYFNFSVRSDVEIFSFGLGVTYGNEKRKELADKTDLLCGLQYGLQGLYIDSPLGRLTAGVSYLIGVQYRASEQFNIGIEFLPGIAVSFGLFDDTAIGIQGSASLNNALSG